MSTDLSATNLAAGGLFRHTLNSFRSESTAWEGEVELLFDDIDRFLASESGLPTSSVDSSAVIEDLASLKGLVEQQTDVLTALVNALTGQPPATDSTGTDDVIDSVLGQFEQLQHTDGMD